MKHRSSILTLTIAVLILAPFVFISCEHEAQLSYKIKNDTSAPLKIIRTNTDGGVTTDTLVLPPNDQITIAVNRQGIGNVWKYKENGEKLRDFTTMDIFKNDSVKSKTDFLKTERWVYKETDKYAAEYVLTVSPTDF